MNTLGQYAAEIIFIIVFGLALLAPTMGGSDHE